MSTENDITPKASLMLWAAFFALVLASYFTIMSLTIYFKVEAENEYEVKVGGVQSQALMEHRQLEKEQLEGIEEAIKKVVHVSN